MNVHIDMLTMYIIIYKLVHVHGNQPLYKIIQLLWTCGSVGTLNRSNTCTSTNKNCLVKLWGLLDRYVPADKVHKQKQESKYRYQVKHNVLLTPIKVLSEPTNITLCFDAEASYYIQHELSCPP